MASILPGYEYDIFISYRHNDNRSGWVTEFVAALQEELAATIKESVSVYFDTNPHDGLLETHNVDKSLQGKLKCLIFIPIISQTYCDPKSFAWQNEFCSFNKYARKDQFGLDIKLSNGNVASRILPVKIHDLDREDTILLETELGGVLRAIEFIFTSLGVNRPLTPSDNPDKNQNQTFYRDQINKVGNAIHEIIRGIKESKNLTSGISNESIISQAGKVPFTKKLIGRNVIRASLVYILTALVFWKVLVISSGLLHLTENIIQLITLVLIILFPFAILLAWLYERSPLGFIRTGSAAPQENTFTDEKKKPFTSYTFILLLFATTIGLFILFPNNSSTRSMNNIANFDKSIGVLPFKNMSNDPAQEYFSDGMKEEILNHLFKIGGLRIPSSSATSRFKDLKLSIREIARELNVAYVLEGNVSKSGNNVRIIVRLINGKNGELVWTEDYKCSMTATDMLEIQSDVAQRVAESMKVVIDPDVKKRIEAKPTLNTEAYTLFLQAWTEFLPFDIAKTKLERAIYLDPGYADAYAQLAYYWLHQGGYGGHLVREQVLIKAEPLLKKALQLDNNSLVAHATMAVLSLYYYWDFESAEKEIRIFKQLNPSNSDLEYFVTDYLLSSGKFNEAFIFIENALKQNKKEENWIEMALTYNYNRQPEKALETIQTANKLFPDDAYLLINFVKILVYQGKYDKAITLYEKSFPDQTLNKMMPLWLVYMGISYYKNGDKKKSAIFLEELLSRSRISSGGSPSFCTAAFYAAKGDTDKAIQFLEMAYAHHEVEMYWLKVDPLFNPLHRDPRFQNLLLKIGFK